MKTPKNFLSGNIPPARFEVERMNPYSAPLEGRRDLLRLDFNENTIGPSPKVIKAIRNISSEEISIYPEYDGLQEAVAKNGKQRTVRKLRDGAFVKAGLVQRARRLKCLPMVICDTAPSV